MTDELKPSPEAVRVARIIDPAAWQRQDEILLNLEYENAFGKMLEQSAAKRLIAPSLTKAQNILNALRHATMQPAIQAAVDALDAVEAAQINPTYGWNITALNKARPLVASALATLRTVTEQGEGA